MRTASTHSIRRVNAAKTRRAARALSPARASRSHWAADATFISPSTTCPQAKADPARFSINGLGYLLVEVPDYGLPPALTETFYELQLAGLTPILTHPERNPTLQKDPDRMKDWLRGGVLIQVTADSLTGHKGKHAQRMAHDLLEKRWVHFLATDAHNTTSRPPRMREAHDLVATKYGASYAHCLCVIHPLAVFLGKQFELAEEPRGVFEEVKEPKPGGSASSAARPLSISRSC